jgi:predicted nucleic acid-binding protein
LSIYLDSSALVKLVIRESESESLITFLDERNDTNLVTSALSRVEVARAAATGGPEVRALAHSHLASIDQIAIDDEVLLRASQIFADERLRTLDAIHLASALSIGASLKNVVTYDQRMTNAARRLGLDVVAPA